MEKINLNNNKKLRKSHTLKAITEQKKEIRVQTLNLFLTL